MKFIRTTHNGNGRCKPFFPKAWQYRAPIDDALRAENPLTRGQIDTPLSIQNPLCQYRVRHSKPRI